MASQSSENQISSISDRKTAVVIYLLSEIINSLMISDIIFPNKYTY